MKRLFGFSTVLCTTVAAVWFFGGVAALATGLPQTGQTECFDEFGAPVDCATGANPGQDGFYQAGTCSASRFFEPNPPDGTVTDACTGLMWVKSPDTTGDGIADSADRMLFCDALTYCENLNFATHSDWRLPNVFELESIVDYGSVGPAIDTLFFDVDIEGGGASQHLYWSSSRLHTRNTVAAVHFSAGAVSRQNVSPTDNPVPFNVRAVRSLPAGAGAGGGAVAQGEGEGGGGFAGNGDVNGDGEFDLSDAIYTLAHLFQGGPAPVACPEAPGGGGCVETNCNNNVDDDEDGSTDCADFDCIVDANCLTGDLPKTGRTACWNDRSIPAGEAEAILCADTGICPGQDGFYQLGCGGAGRFVPDPGNTGTDADGMPVDDTVLDTCTGLEWTRALVDVTGDGTLDASDAGGTWAQALAACEALVFADKSDWRLPNVREMLSISTFEPFGNDPFGGSTLEAIFDNPEIGVENWHWTSTTTAATNRAIVYSMASSRNAGISETASKQTGVGVPVFRAVRGGQTNN